MLFLLLQLGAGRYAVEAKRVVEVVPLLEVRPMPGAPEGLAGFFDYHGRPVPAIDLCALTLGRPARALLSTRILIVEYGAGRKAPPLLGLIAEQATEMLRCEPGEFVDTGCRLAAAPFLGPVYMAGNGPVQWLLTDQLLPKPVRDILFGDAKALPAPV